MAFAPRIVESGNAAAVAGLLARRTRNDPRLVGRVARIVERVKRHGDRAVIDYARQFDKLTGPIEVSRAEMHAAARLVPREVRRAIAAAAANIRQVATRQLPRPWTLRPAPGVRIVQRVLALDRVGCYVPGGRYPLPSSLLMTAIPARAAGVREIIAVCPRPDATILFAARQRRSPTAPGRFHPSTRSSAQATPMSQPRSRSSPPTARSTSMPDRVRSRSCRRRDVRHGSQPI